MKASIADLESLRVEITEKGFTLWVTEKYKDKDDKVQEREHWLLDGSLIKEDGVIRIGNADVWEMQISHVRKEKALWVVRKKIKNKKT